MRACAQKFSQPAVSAALGHSRTCDSEGGSLYGHLINSLVSPVANRSSVSGRRCPSDQRPCMDPESRRELTLLEAVSEDGGQVTQRGLATRMGVALGLTNMYLKRLVRKGYIKCVNMQSNRLLYLITPAGIAEKTRLTYEYMDYSLQLYRDARRSLRRTLEVLVSGRDRATALYGTGEAAELAYLCLRELGIEPVAIFSEDGEGAFFGVVVTPVSAHRTVAFDVLVVATLDDPAPLIDALQAWGIARGKLVPIRQPLSQGAGS